MSAVANLGTPVTLKEDRVQLVTDVFGDIRQGNVDGHGLYMLDTRYLSAFELAVEGQQPLYLSHSAERNYIATFQFVNPALVLGNGTTVRRQTISVRRSRFVDGKGLYERIGLYNCNQFEVEIDVTLTFDADFLDIFAVRRYASQRRTAPHSIRFGGDRLTFAYDGRDGIKRRTVVTFDREAEAVSYNSLLFRLRLRPHVPESITLHVQPTANRASTKALPFDLALTRLAESYEVWHRRSTDFTTDNAFFDHSLLRQSRLDVRALLEVSQVVSDEGGRRSLFVPSAGIPWYAVPFGRDSLITALQTLTYNPDIAEGTLRTLARYQGREVDEETEEEPGKIFHEIRRGELAHMREIPHLPYYGTVDATPLFVVLFVETMAWLGFGAQGAALYRDLLPAAIRALEWVDGYGDPDGDGYVEYRGGRPGRLRNQGWKDSGDSLQYADGQTASLPAALVEVQGYVYQAKMGLSRLAERRGDAELAARLREEARALRVRFNEDFWMEEESCFAQALDAEKQRVPSVTSNPGHVLWSGIVDADRAAVITHRLLKDDMFSGWGIRTLSSASANYNPMSYHNGSVWPHDNSIIAHGMARCGFAEQAAEVISAVIAAGLRFPSNRLPELFCGFIRDRRFNSSPVAYIVSCSPQAWSAAAPFLFLQTLLGAEAVDGCTLRLEPAPNDLFRGYHVGHMRVGEGHVSFEVQHKGKVCEIRKLDGDIELVSESAALV